MVTYEGKRRYWDCTRKAKPYSDLCGRCKFLMRREREEQPPIGTGYTEYDDYGNHTIVPTQD